MNGLSQFFDHEKFLRDKTLTYMGSKAWSEDGNLVGSKVTVAISSDQTKYAKEETSNVGETFTVKIRGVLVESLAQLVPLKTNVRITEVERATVWGDFRNQLSVIGKISIVKEA